MENLEVQRHTVCCPLMPPTVTRFQQYRRFFRVDTLRKDYLILYPNLYFYILISIFLFLSFP